MGKRNGAIEIVKNALRERLRKINAGEHVEWTTQNSFYYYLRVLFLQAGIDPADQGEHFRKNQTRSISKICNQELGKSREMLKIIADARATFYYNNQTYYISYDDVKKLYHYGSDIIIIEKSDLCNLFAPLAAKSGIALIDTGGYAVDYAKQLADYAEQYDCHVSILSDFDADGVLLSYDVWKNSGNNIYKIGIDFDCLDELEEMYPGLDLSDEALQEGYKPSNSMKRLKDLKEHLEESRFNITQGKQYTWNLDYLSQYRIEIDSVQRVLGRDRMWNYILMKLEKRFPERNYNRVIDQDKLNELPDQVTELINAVRNKVKSRYDELIEEKILNFNKYEGISPNVYEDESSLEKYIKNELSLDISDICDKIQDLADEINESIS